MTEVSPQGLVAALAAAQAEFPSIERNRENAHFKSKYADLSAVLAAVRPVLAKHGIALTQTTEIGDSGGVELVTRLHYGNDGQEFESRWPLAVDGVGPQQIGSLLSYMRRYQVSAMLGVAPDDDDDGFAAQTVPARAAYTAPVEVSLDKDLGTMSVRELHSAAEQLGHTFTGAVSKAEMVRQLSPLWHARTGAEPFEVSTANAPAEDEGAAVADHTQAPTVAANPARAAREHLSGSERQARNSVARSERSGTNP